MKLLRPVALVTAVATSAILPTPTSAAEVPADRTGAAEVPTAPDFELPAVQLRIGLDRILAEHAFLSIEAMRTGVGRGR